MSAQPANASLPPSTAAPLLLYRAGIEGDETCRYPLLLSPHIVWPAGVVPGGEMRQQHDTDMLEMELQRTR